MPFDIVTSTRVLHHAPLPPRMYGIGRGLPSSPSTEGYIVTPQRRLTENFDSHIRIFPTSSLRSWNCLPRQLSFGLSLWKKNSQHWESEIPVLERQLNRQTDAAFAGTAHTKVYWIGTIGPHWRYGRTRCADPYWLASYRPWPSVVWRLSSPPASCCCSLVALVSGFHDAIVTNAVSRGAASSEESYMGPIRL